MTDPTQQAQRMFVQNQILRGVMEVEAMSPHMLFSARERVRRLRAVDLDEPVVRLVCDQESQLPRAGDYVRTGSVRGIWVTSHANQETTFGLALRDAVIGSDGNAYVYMSYSVPFRDPERIEVSRADTTATMKLDREVRIGEPITVDGGSTPIGVATEDSRFDVKLGAHTVTVRLTAAEPGSGVASVGVVEKVHEEALDALSTLPPGTWHSTYQGGRVEHLFIGYNTESGREPNATCLRCFGPAYVGLGLPVCDRANGCLADREPNTLSAKQAEDIRSEVDGIGSVRGEYVECNGEVSRTGGEVAWFANVNRDGYTERCGPFATRQLAVDCWRLVKLFDAGALGTSRDLANYWRLTKR